MNKPFEHPMTHGANPEAQYTDARPIGPVKVAMKANLERACADALNRAFETAQEPPKDLSEVALEDMIERMNQDAEGRALSVMPTVVKFPVPLFDKATALRGWCTADLSEVALEDAIAALASGVAPKDCPKAYTVVIHKAQEVYAAKLVDELERLRNRFPWNVPTTSLKVDHSFTKEDEWALLADDGRAYYSPGA